MAITFIRPRLIILNGTSLTDHNRGELGVNVERIETRQRMANGTMRKYWVADKRTFTVSWDNLPNLTAQTVDGFAGGQGIEDIFNAATGAITLAVYGRSVGEVNNYSVVFNDFSKNVVKRWATYEMWSVNITLEEV